MGRKSGIQEVNRENVSLYIVITTLVASKILGRIQSTGYYL